MAEKTIFPTENTYIAQYFPDKNFDLSWYAYFSQYKQAGDVYRALIRFSLSSIPKHRIINSAWLNLRVYRNEIPRGTSIYCGLQRALEPWFESSVTWNDQPAYKLVTTFMTSFADTNNTILTKDVTNLVRSWYNGTKPNYGIVLTGDEGMNSLVGIYTSFYPDDTRWPSLVVNYSKC